MDVGDRVGVGVMEQGHGHWNPGIALQQQQTDVVWPQMQQQQPGCALMTDEGQGPAPISMFSYPNLISLSADGSSPVVPHLHHRMATEFRHRFPHSSSIHSFTTGHELDMGPHPHGLVEVQETERNSAVVGQDGQSMGIDNVLGGECSEDGTEDDEDESDEDEMHIDGATYIHNQELPSCQHPRQQLGLIDDGSSCHQKNGLLSHVHEMEEDIPPINQQGHPLNSNPISAIPMITGNCSSMMMPEDEQVNTQTNSVPQQIMSSEPPGCNLSAGGQPVNGKMYAEERITFHLKQWTWNSGFGNFNSCREQEQSKQLYRCAVCHTNRTSHNNIQEQKDAHRHPVRGVLYTFEDLIILELYPEDYMEESASGSSDSRANAAQSMAGKHNLQMDEEKETSQISYFGGPSNGSVQNMEKLVTSDPGQEEWWEDFDSSRQVIQERTTSTITSSQAVNLKLNAQNFHDAQAEDELVQEHQEDNGSEEYADEESIERHNEIQITYPAQEIQTSNNLEIRNSDEKNNSSDLKIEGQLQQNSKVDGNDKNDQSTKTEPKKKKANDKYACPCCDQLFSLKRILKSHLEEKHEVNPFQCSLCKMQYADVRSLGRHSCTLSVDTIKQRLKLKDNCKKENETNEVATTANTSKDIIISNNNDEESGNEEMTIVPKSSKIRKFSQKSNTTTTQANKQATIETPLSQREVITNDDDDDTENELDVDYESKIRHINSNKPFNSSCSKTIKINQDENRDKLTKAKEFVCNVCSKAFTVERRLINHAACHRPDRISQCEKCGKRFARRDKLMRHMFVHATEKAFSCEVCEKKFSRRDKLSDHLKSHKTDEIHQCTFCAKQFLRPDILKQHVKLHKLKNKFQCSECLRFVTGKERLAQHMKRHEEAKTLGLTLLCPLCTKYFIQRQSLKAHIRKFHPDALDQLNLNNEDQDGDEEEEASQGSSSSSSSSDPKSPDTAIGKNCSKQRSTKTKSETTTVCMVLENVMSSVKGGPSKNSSELPKPFSCSICLQNFARKQALKKHEILKHSSSGKQSVGKNCSKEPNEKDSDISKSKTSTATISTSESEESLPNPKTTKSIKVKEKSNKVSTKKISQQKSQEEVPTTSVQENMIHQLPSCASLTNDLSYASSPYALPSPHNLNSLAYSQLALSMVGNVGRGISPFVSPAATNNPNINSHHHLQYQQHQNSIQIIPQAQVSSSGSLLCTPTNPYIMNYPNPTMNFHDPTT